MVCEWKTNVFGAWIVLTHQVYGVIQGHQKNIVVFERKQ